MSRNQVATTILEQLGGRRFIAMTGAHSFVGDGDALIMTVSGQSKTGKVSRLKIELAASDTYTMTAYGMTKIDGMLGVVERYKCEGLYFDNLATAFEEATGLRTSL